MFMMSLMDYVPQKAVDMIGEKFEITDNVDEASAIMVRDMDMSDFELSRLVSACGSLDPKGGSLPLDRLTDRGIPVITAGNAGSNAVKEMVIGVIINSLRKFDRAALRFSADGSEDQPDEVYTGMEMSGKTVSVLGLGKTGVMTANALAALGMHVIGFDPGITLEAAHRLSPDVEITSDPITLFRDSDFVTLCVESSSTTDMIDSSLLELFKRGAVLINFTDADTVNEEAVIEAVESGVISEYVTDFPSPALEGIGNITCYPGISGRTEESSIEAAVSISDDLYDFIKNGNIRNSLNFPDCSLGPIENENRVCICTKNVPDPLTLASAIMSDVKIDDMDGGLRDDAGYVLVSTRDEITSVPQIEGVTRIRVLTDI
ncbi:MAG: NAD(P)-dependent oxidoreductase [Anaerovoracaceae bacterium]